MSKLPIPDLGAYLREQRESAQLSLRQLADVAGVSNPYLSQIERGLKRPSAEILQQIAKGLQVSAESLYVRAGILDERGADGDPAAGPDVITAIAADPALNDRQRGVLVEVYRSFVGATDTGVNATQNASSRQDARAADTEPTPPRRRTPRGPSASAARTPSTRTTARATRTAKTATKTASKTATKTVNQKEN